MRIDEALYMSPSLISQFPTFASNVLATLKNQWNQRENTRPLTPPSGLNTRGQMWSQLLSVASLHGTILLMRLQTRFCLFDSTRGPEAHNTSRIMYLASDSPVRRLEFTFGLTVEDGIWLCYAGCMFIQRSAICGKEAQVYHLLEWSDSES